MTPRSDPLIQQGSVLYINLDSRTDRRREVEKELQDVGWPIERLSATEPDPRNDTHATRAAACTASHLRALKILYERGVPFCTVIEDDAMFEKGSIVCDLERRLSSVPFDMFLLGVNVPKYTAHRVRDLVKVKSSFTTTGYIIKREAVPDLVAVWENTNKPADVAWSEVMSKREVIAPRTPIVYQRPSFSDIEGHHTNHRSARKKLR